MSLQRRLVALEDRCGGRLGITEQAAREQADRDITALCAAWGRDADDRETRRQAARELLDRAMADLAARRATTTPRP